jgi:hypothetical protein
MKKVILILAIVSALLSCNESTNNKQVIDSNKIEISKLEEAKNTAKQIFEFVEQAETKQISKKELDKKAKPLQAHLDSLRIILTQGEVKELDDYRTILVSEMVDRKVIRDRK